MKHVIYGAAVAASLLGASAISAIACEIGFSCSGPGQPGSGQPPVVTCTVSYTCKTK